MEIEIKLNWLC